VKSAERWSQPSIFHVTSRWHSESSVDDSADDERQQPRSKDHALEQQKRSGWDPYADQSPKIPRDKTSKSVHPVSEDFVRNAVLCMLRRTSGNNLSSLLSYLRTYFPDIPEQCRVPVVVAAFAAAQKVAATHIDVVLGADEERAAWGKKNIARWMQGLSAIEPQQERTRHQLNLSSAEQGVYSPTTNFLVTRDMPLPIDSAFGQQQMAEDFNDQDEAQAEDPQPRENLFVSAFPTSVHQVITDVEPRDTTSEQQHAVSSSADAALTSVAISTISAANSHRLSMPVLTFYTQEFTLNDDS